MVGTATSAADENSLTAVTLLSSNCEHAEQLGLRVADEPALDFTAE
jgi:hypothetical protein